MKLPFDHYTIHARLAPVFVLMAPLGIMLIAWFPKIAFWKTLPTALAIPLVLTFLFSQLGRDLGKKKEPDLYKKWGGIPTDKIIAHEEGPIDKNTWSRYRNKLSLLLPDIALPDENHERLNPDSAVATYRSCTNFLREKTRDSKNFPLIFSENINYGFRRNLWALKSAGIFISAISIFFTLFALIAVSSGQGLAVVIACLLVNISLLVWWVLRINPTWVKVPADEYARQLFAACENL